MFLLNSILGTFSHDLAIDLGTANTLFYMKEKGIVLNEPSVVAIKRHNNGGSEILTVGKEAKMMIDRTPGNIVAVRPIRKGVIANFEVTQTMLKYFLRKVYKRVKFIRPRVIISVPSGITPVEKMAVRESVLSLGVREVFFIEELMAAAIGAGLPITEPRANMLVDIGGGTTEVAIISLAGVVNSQSVKVAGDEMDEAILQYIKRKYKILMGRNTAEHIKIKIGNAYPDKEIQTIQAKGIDLTTGIPKILILDSDEIRDVILEQVNTIIRTVTTTLEQISPEVAADLINTGILMTGGGSMLKNLEVLLRDRIRLPIKISNNPLTDVVVGSGKTLSNLSVISEVAI